MSVAEFNEIRDNLEQILVTVARQLLDHTGAASLTIPAANGDPAVRISR